MNNETDPAIITPLRRLLLNQTLDQLALFLSDIGADWNVRGRGGSGFSARVWTEGAPECEVHGEPTAHRALAHATAKYLVVEKRDYHAVAK